MKQEIFPHILPPAFKSWLYYFEYLNQTPEVLKGQNVEWMHNTPGGPILYATTVDKIKAKAFDEIYPRLPDKVDVFQAMRETQVIGSERLLDFLEGLPQKKVK